MGRAKRPSARGAKQRQTTRSQSVGPASHYPGELRIIGGIWRSRRLTVPLSAGLRPTPNRVRETLFNWLQPYVPGASCLDLFSGTGALCLEALSRGAGSAVMVEQAALAAAALKNNVAMLGAERAQVIHADALAFLADGGLSGKNSTPSFDIIFIDPPFRSELIERCIKLISTHGWLNSGGLVYVEAPRNFGNLELPSSWEIINSKKTGRVGYHLARNRL